MSHASVSDDSSNADWLYSVEINRLVLKAIGVWPRSLCASKAEKVHSMVLQLISFSMICFLLIPCCMCILLDKTGGIVMKLKSIGPGSFCVMAAVKHCILVSRGHEIARCIENIRYDWALLRDSKEDREILKSSARMGRFMAMFCAGFMYSAGFVFVVVMPFFTERTEIIDNQTIKSQPFPIYRGILDPRTSPSVEIVQWMQSFAAYVMYTVTVGACSLAAVFATHACGQCRILIHKLNRLVDGRGGAKKFATQDERLGDIVEHHFRILSFISKMDDLLNEICFVEVIGCTINICFLGYYLLTFSRNGSTTFAVATLAYCTLLISFTFNIFILCYIGEIISEEYKRIGVAAYMIDWYRLPEKTAQSLILILAVSNSFTRLTAGKIFELSLPSFCSILKSSMAYFSLLRTIAI